MGTQQIDVSKVNWRILEPQIEIFAKKMGDKIREIITKFESYDNTTCPTCKIAKVLSFKDDIPHEHNAIRCLVSFYSMQDFDKHLKYGEKYRRAFPPMEKKGKRVNYSMWAFDHIMYELCILVVKKELRGVK